MFPVICLPVVFPVICQPVVFPVICWLRCNEIAFIINNANGTSERACQALIRSDGTLRHASPTTIHYAPFTMIPPSCFTAISSQRANTLLNAALPFITLYNASLRRTTFSYASILFTTLLYSLQLLISLLLLFEKVGNVRLGETIYTT